LASDSRKSRDYLRLTTGFTAALVSLFFGVKNHTDPYILIASLYFVVACTVDTFKSKIPNILNASLAVAGLVLFFHNDGWNGLLVSLTGLALGIGLLIVPWLMGGMGAGDVKALGALGALLGPYPLLQVFIYMGLIGGAMAILHYAFERNLRIKATAGLNALKASVLTNDPSLVVPEKIEKSRFPYATAIAFGYCTYLATGSIF